MIVISASLVYVLFVLFLFLRVLAYTTEDSYLYRYMNTSNDFENNTIEEYDTSTDTSDVSKDYHNFSRNVLKIIEVNPTEVIVDTITELQLLITSSTVTNTTPVFCFLSTPDNDLEVLSSYWISDTQLNCTGFGPIVPGLFSLTADFPNDGLNLSDKILTVNVRSKHPVAERAEYSYSFDKMFIHFDGNIELQSNCASTFSKKTAEYFGTGFRCSIMGSALIVKMGGNFKPTAIVEIGAENRICRSGSRKRFCLTAKPGNVTVKAPRVPGPRLSLLTISECVGNTTETYMRLQVSSNDKKQNSDEVSLRDRSGKNQRKNLIIWRTMRRIQSKWSSNLTFQIDKPNMEHLENLASIENFLENKTIQVGSSPSGVTVSVHILSSPTVGTIIAEANVMFCKNFNQLFQYKWIVNERIIPEDDKLINVQGVSPGKYTIKCNIVAFNSSEVLGQGWATTEIFDSRPKVIVYPVEVVIAATEDVSLYAVMWQGDKISWTCTTKIGKVCITKSQELVSDVLNMNSSNISIPAGILPPGEYMWMVENTKGVNTAKIIIKLESTATIKVQLGSVFVEQPRKIILRGTAEGLQNGCRLWWSSVEGDTEVLIRDGETEQNIDLIFPRSPENWKDLEADSLYMFKLQAFCPRSISYIKIPISVNNPPRISPLKIEPTKGSAMATNFIISKVEADDSVEDYPLLFEWSYLDTCGVEIPITRGVYSKQVTTFLPPGDIKMIVRVCDVKKACAKVSSSVIDVSQSKIIPENFQNAANQIYYLMLGPDYLEAFGLATTVFKSLVLKAETEVRRAVFKSVEEGIYRRIKQFSENMEATSKGVKSCQDFVDSALNIARYFPKGSGIDKYLTDFKNNVLKNLKKHKT